MSISKGSRDHLAAAIVADSAKSMSATVHGKNAAAVMLGKLGGLKGGRARAARLSPARRKEIAVAASKARWNKNNA
jgi:hypothetical protein